MSEKLNAILDEIKEGITGDEAWTHWFPSEEAAMQWQELLRKQPGCEHADLRSDDHYIWPGKEEA